jgi:hypothetical protein
MEERDEEAEDGGCLRVRHCQEGGAMAMKTRG